MDADIKNEFEKIHGAIESLAQSTAKGFAAVDKRFELMEHRVGGLEEEVKSVKHTLASLPEEIGEAVERTYGPMLNDHEDRITALERT